MDHPSLAELAAVWDGRLPPDREREVTRHLLFERCTHCLAVIPGSLRMLLGLEPPLRPTTAEEEDAYESAIERASGFALEYERQEKQRRVQAEKGLKALETGLKLPHSLDPQARIRALLDRSWQLRHDDPRQMMRLARSAAKASLRLSHSAYGLEQVRDLQAEAHAELGNAYRAADHFEDAIEAMGKAREFFERGTRNLLLEVRILELEASLLADLRQYGPAAHKLLKVMRFYSQHEDFHRLGRTLVLLGLYSGYSGKHDQGIHWLEQSLKLIDPKRDPGLACAAAHNLILFLVDCDRISEAKKLRIVHSRYLVNPGGRVNQIKFRLLEGRIDAGLGNFSRAEAIFREVIESFEQVGLPLVAGIERLDLAAVLLRQGKVSEATNTILEAVKVFTTLRIQREALQAIVLLRDSFELGRGTLEMVVEVASFLRRLEIDPELRFEGRCWNLPDSPVY